MSAYSPFLAGSQHSPHSSKLTPHNRTPTKQMCSVVSSPDLFSSAHHPRPTTHIFPSAHLKPTLPNTHPPTDQKQNISPNNTTNNLRKFQYKPQNISPIATQPPLRNTPNQQPKYFKARKSSENNIVFESRALKTPTTTKEIKTDFSPVATPQKERKGSFNYDLLQPHTTKQPRFSMAEVLPIEEEIGARRARKKGKQWEETNNFQMDPEAPQNQSIMKIKIESPKASKSPQIQRKHSDNECAKRTPAFLMAPKWGNKSESTTPRAKFNIQRFRIIKQLGRGAFGRVVLAIQKESSFVCAIKILSKRDLREENMIQQLVREIKIQSSLSHPNVIKIYGFFDDLLHFYIVMECALDQRLSDLLEKNRLSEQEAAIIFYQLCTAVAQMHSFTIIHRDLKPQNVMLHQQVVKVCDFGWSVYRGGQLRSTFCGTPLYLSPQILMGNSYDQSVDVWTLGIILYEMVIGGSPFGITRSEQLVNIVNEKVDLSNKNISSDLGEVISSCLEKRAENRPNVKWLLGQSWVKKGQPEGTRRQSLVNQ